MTTALAIGIFLFLGAAGIVWTVRRDDARRASPKTRRRGDGGSDLQDAGAYGAAASLSDGDGGCDVGDAGGGDCGGGGGD